MLAPTAKMSHAVFNKQSNLQTDKPASTEDDHSEEDPYAASKMDYTIPVTASEIFRANFQMNRTIKKKKGIKQWIPSNNEYWFSLKCQLS